MESSLFVPRDYSLDEKEDLIQNIRPKLYPSERPVPMYDSSSGKILGWRLEADED